MSLQKTPWILWSVRQLLGFRECWIVVEATTISLAAAMFCGLGPNKRCPQCPGLYALSPTNLAIVIKRARLLGEVRSRSKSQKDDVWRQVTLCSFILNALLDFFHVTLTSLTLCRCSLYLNVDFQLTATLQWLTAALQCPPLTLSGSGHVSKMLKLQLLPFNSPTFQRLIHELCISPWAALLIATLQVLTHSMGGTFYEPVRPINWY